MRHRIHHRKLGRNAEHRRALMRNLATQLLDKGTIRTTVAKAKELRSYTEKLITTASKDTLAARRRILRDINDKGVVHKLFESIAPRYADREGGYTRILRLGIRHGDKAEMALIQLVEDGDSLQPKHGKRRAPRPDDPNAPLEVKKKALKLSGSGEASADASEEAAAEEAAEDDAGEASEE